MVGFRGKPNTKGVDAVPAWFYILRLESGALYVGATRDLERRWREHQDGKACRTTRLDPPAELTHSEEFDDFETARRREGQVKRWTRAKKEALAQGDIETLKDLSKRREE